MENITYEDFLTDLKTHYDEKRSLFNQKILKTSKEVLGLTTKEIKDLAKKYKDISFDSFDLDRVYEVTLLYFLVSINRLETIEEKIKFYKDNVVLIDTRAITDTIAPYLKDASFEDALNLISNDDEFIIRLGCVLMLNHSKDGEHTRKILNSLKFDTRDNVRNAEGRLMSYLFMYDFDVTYNWAQSNYELDEITLIGIQKGIDSHRISEENKNKLRQLRKQLKSVF